MKLRLIDQTIINQSKVLKILNKDDTDNIDINLTFEEHNLILDYLNNSFDKIKLDTFNIIQKIKYFLLPIDKFINNYIIFGKYEDKLIENNINLPKFTLFNASINKWCILAALNDNLECLKYAHENRYPWSSDTCKFAAFYGHLECLKYAHENGCPWNEYTSYFAASNGKLNCLKYAYEQNCPWNELTCMYAAYNGNLNCLKYAHENGCSWNSDTCECAASNGHLNCLKYAHQNGCKYDKKELLLICNTQNGLTSGNINCKQYIELNM
jgi:hypothetical protein